MSILGTSFIGFGRGSETSVSFRASDPATGRELEPAFYAASHGEVDTAVRLANSAFDTFRSSSQSSRSTFLNTIAENIESIMPDLIERVPSETGLPEARIRTEAARTCSQLRM